MNLSTNAMLASVKISQWSARKLDRKVTDETNQRHNAAPDSGRYNKSLLAAGALAEVTSAFNEIRAFHYSRTAPWFDDGARIIAAAGLSEYDNGMAALIAASHAKVIKFLTEYPTLRAEARSRLGDMFNETDYPTVEDVESRFSVERRIMPVPDSSDFRVDLGAAKNAEVKARIDAATRQAAQVATRDAWNRIVEHVTRMVERLEAYKPARPPVKATAVFHDSVVVNICKLCAALPSLNLTNDKRLADMADRLETELAFYSGEELRTNENKLAETLKLARALLSDVNTVLSAMH